MNATTALDRLRDVYAAYHRAYVARETDPDRLARARLDLALVLSQEDDLPTAVVEQVAEDARHVLHLP